LTQVDQPLYVALGMTAEEYDDVCDILGRAPEPAELAMYSVMWSEHCSYKSSRAHLGRFPTEAPWVVVGPGENAGVVDLGDGWLAALRIESHNHPSFVEPYQGAATGVGGILRDVFTMGARPIALWDPIRFGPLDDAHNRYLFNGVVKGIAGYGNAVGVPTVGGELEFDDCYSGNPLVNVMCLGVLRREQLVLGTAGPPGSVAVLLGSSTGRDGIGGASVLASATFDDEKSDKRPSVQVGDPFEEKKLIEACLELCDKDLVVGVQDLGAAGLSCAFSEPAARAGVGMDVDLDAVHTREPGMSAAELLMSESQERMMAFVHPDKVDEVQAVASKWEIEARVVGAVRSGGTLRIRYKGELVAEVPAATLSENAPLLQRPIARPEWLDDVWANSYTPMRPPHIAEALSALLADPNVADPSWVYEQYDHMLFLNTMVEPGHDGTLLRLRGTQKGLAVSTDGNGRVCFLDPRRGAARIVWEAALNVALTGARPLAVVDNLNFGNPEKPEVMWQFVETVDGLSDACRDIGVPVVGGNVSFYNTTDDEDIYPTPVVGLLGLADPIPHQPPRLDRARPGDELWLFGPLRAINLAGSLTHAVIFNHRGGRPSAPDADIGAGAIELAIELAGRGLVHAQHDISDGGLAVAVSEIAIKSNIGATIGYEDWRHLFCEDPHRFIAAVPIRHSDEVADLASAIGINAARIGLFGGDRITFEHSDGSFDGIDLVAAAMTWRNAIRELMD
jgi:phosphoribosylformylglycinamidine synthase II